jgi:hypothetical protein
MESVRVPSRPGFVQVTQCTDGCTTELPYHVEECRIDSTKKVVVLLSYTPRHCSFLRAYTTSCELAGLICFSRQYRHATCQQHLCSRTQTKFNRGTKKELSLWKHRTGHLPEVRSERDKPTASCAPNHLGHTMQSGPKQHVTQTPKCLHAS